MSTTKCRVRKTFGLLWTAIDRYSYILIMSIEPIGVANPSFEFCDRLRKVRRTIAGMSQAEMALKLGVGRQAYAAWESGVSRPTDIVAVARQVANLWPAQVTAAWMLDIDLPGDPRPPINEPVDELSNAA